MDGQTDVGHINLIGGLVTRNPPKNTFISIQIQTLMSRRQSVKWNNVGHMSETG